MASFEGAGRCDCFILPNHTTSTCGTKFLLQRQLLGLSEAFRDLGDERSRPLHWARERWLGLPFGHPQLDIPNQVSECF